MSEQPHPTSYGMTRQAQLMFVAKHDIQIDADIPVILIDVDPEYEYLGQNLRSPYHEARLKVWLYSDCYPQMLDKVDSTWQWHVVLCAEVPGKFGWYLTRKRRNHQELYNDMVDIVEEAFNDVFCTIQGYLDVETGDEAAYWFSGSQLEQAQKVAIEEFREYAKHEIYQAREAENERAAGGTPMPPPQSTPEEQLLARMIAADLVPEDIKISCDPEEAKESPYDLPDVSDPFKRSKRQQAQILIAAIRNLSGDPLTRGVVRLPTWDPSVDEASGCVFWSSPIHDLVIYATPLYEDSVGIAMQASWPDGSVLPMKPIHFNKITLGNYMRLMQEHLPTYATQAEAHRERTKDRKKHWVHLEIRDERIQDIEIFDDEKKAKEAFVEGWFDDVGSHLDPAEQDPAREIILRDGSWTVGEITTYLKEVYV